MGECVETGKQELLGMGSGELADLVAGMGEKPFRWRQIYHHLYRRRCFDPERMTDMSADFRRNLFQLVRLHLPTAVETRESDDGSAKFLFGLDCGGAAESVFIPEDGRTTVCLSTQSGCAMGCRFCATASIGFLRDLTPGEILGQLFHVCAAKKLDGCHANVVFMGMGEPLENAASLEVACGILTDPRGVALSRRRVTVSTCGHVDGMGAMGEWERRPKLAVSLNAADDALRSSLMPVNRRFPLDRLLAACRKFPLGPGERITFEYVLLAGVNDRDEDARRTAGVLAHIPCKINLIPYNPTPFSPFAAPCENRVAAFQKILVDRHYTAIIRKSRGKDIAGACGQLAGGLR